MGQGTLSRSSEHERRGGQASRGGSAEEGQRFSHLCPQATPAHHRTIDSPPPGIKKQRTSQRVTLTPTVCKVLTFDQIVEPSIPFFSTVKFQARLQELGLSSMATPHSFSPSAHSVSTARSSLSVCKGRSPPSHSSASPPPAPLNAVDAAQGKTPASFSRVLSTQIHTMDLLFAP